MGSVYWKLPSNWAGWLSVSEFDLGQCFLKSPKNLVSCIGSILVDYQTLRFTFPYSLLLNCFPSILHLLSFGEAVLPCEVVEGEGMHKGIKRKKIREVVVNYQHVFEKMFCWNSKRTQLYKSISNTKIMKMFCHCWKPFPLWHLENIMTYQLQTPNF